MVKFISFAENQIEKTGEGIVAFVTNHSYIDNPTFVVCAGTYLRLLMKSIFLTYMEIA